MSLIITDARNKVYSAANSAMVTAYWNIGRIIYEQEQKGKDRVEYGQYIIRNLSAKLTREFGKGFTSTNLKYMRQFYATFPIGHTLCDQLSWSHYRHLMRVTDEKARLFYMEECSKSNWSVRQLERQINSFFYERLLSN